MTIGADVSKELLTVSSPDGSSVHTIQNSIKYISIFLESIESGSTIAMEATGKYHRLLADTAFFQGFRVIVFNPKDVLHYARSISPRAKTDRVDAKVIAGYALARPDHHTYKPVPEIAARLKGMLNTRASLVTSRVSLQNRMRECPESASYLNTSIEGLNKSIALIDKEILPLVRTFQQYRLFLAIPGFGPVVAPYILAMLASSDFRTSDAFVAFTGLDVRVRQSGKYKGKCRLSKRGDPEARRLLYLAAQAVCRQPGPFRILYLHHQAKGLSKIAALNAVARKLARTAWSIYSNNEPYSADRVCSQRGSLSPAESSLDPITIQSALSDVARCAARTIRQLDHTLVATQSVKPPTVIS